MDAFAGGSYLRGFTFAALFGTWLAATGARAQRVAADRGPQPLEITLRDDAALSSVCFVSANEGCAVGDRGVVWHTRDAGVTWEQQESHVQCELNGVYFLDAARGWAVGGASKPYSASTAGIVLQTADGGRTWSPLSGSQLLPKLSGVRFFSPQQGIAYGAASAMYPSGAYLTRDGGRSWQTAACDATGEWQTGDCLSDGGGALAGVSGRLAMLVGGEVKQSPVTAGSLRTLRGLRLAAPTSGWVVGDGGFVARTNDLGRSWQTPEGQPPNRAGEYFDFHAVALQGPHVWIAGSPGSRVFHSTDGGKTWDVFSTGQTTPLRSLAFADTEHGWAVGALGTILATQDGGRSWRMQRSGGQRAALLGVFARTSDVPLELFAQQGTAEGYLAAVNILFRAPPASASAGTASLAAANPDRAREALLLAGATAGETAWQFPLPPDDVALDSDAMLDALNRANDGRAAERLVSRLVRQLRMWRPDVVVTHDQRPQTGDSLGPMVQQLVMRAVEMAADPAQCVDMASGAGLEPWQVKRVYGVSATGTRGQEMIATGQFSPQLGVTLADWSGPARRLLSSKQSMPPDTYELTLLMDRANSGQSAGHDLFRGLTLPPGGEARRRVAALPAGDVDQMRRLAARRRNLEELLERKAGDAAWSAQVVQLTDGLPDAGGGELVFQLADGYRASGRLDLAADTYYLLARRYPEHPLSEQALRWLVQYYASSEAGARAGGGLGATGSASATGRNVRTAGEAAPTAESTGGASGTLVPTNTGEARGKLVQASATAPIAGDTPPAVGLSRDERLQRAVELGKYLEAARPSLFAEPAVRFPLVAAERQLGYANPAKRFFLSLRSLPESDAWRRCAMTEEWLAEPRDLPPPKMLGRCRRIGERPRLDGKLDEPFWQATEAMRLVNDELRSGGAATRTAASVDANSVDAHSTSTVRLAYDDEFLYIAVRCPKISGADYANDDRPRPHDGDLAAHDRVAIRLDADRDYTTHCELTVDHRGWTRDASLGDPAWNPTWYVAASSDDATWTVEAAVPLAELTAKRPEARSAWAVGVRRTIPRVGYETWSGDAADGDSPEQFGLLLFE